VDTAWVGVIGGAIGGLIGGGVSLLTQWLNHSHQREERRQEKMDAEVQARHSDFAAALEATARLRAAVVGASIDPYRSPRAPDGVTEVSLAQPIAQEIAADFLGSVQRLSLHGIEVDVDETTEHLFEYMTLWPDSQFREPPDLVLVHLADVARRLGQAYRDGSTSPMRPIDPVVAKHATPPLG
jgi:hypothetical protein